MVMDSHLGAITKTPPSRSFAIVQIEIMKGGPNETGGTKMTIDESGLDSIVNEYNAEQGSLISILQDIQAVYNYLPREALEYVARRLNIPQVQVFGVATFFKAFSLEPKGKNRIHVCMGTACHVRGSKGVLEELERKLGVKAGDTTSDGEFTLETVNCVGACALGPVVVKNEEHHGQMTPIKVERLLNGK